MSYNLRKFILCLIVISVMAATSTVFHLTQAFSKDFSRGRRAFEEKDYQTASMYLNAATQLKPSDENTLKYLVAAYDKLGRDQDLLEQLKKLEQIGVHNPKTTIWIADLYYKLGDFENAEVFYRKALTDRKLSRLQKKLAEVLIWQEKYDDALALLDTLPEDAKTIELYAIAYDGLGRDQDVLAQLEKLEDIDYKTSEITIWMAALYYKFNDFEKAEALYQKALAERKSPDLEKKLAEIFTWQKKYSLAIDILEKTPR